MDCVCAYQILDIEDMQLLDILKTQTNVSILYQTIPQILINKMEMRLSSP